MKPRTHYAPTRSRVLTRAALRTVSGGDCTYDGKTYSLGSRVKMSDGSIGMCVYDPYGDKWITVG